MGEYFGKILIASPMLDDTVFARSVVYIFQDNAIATVGVILNQPADENIRAAWTNVIGSEASADHLSFGGPVPGPVIALHRDQSAAEIELPHGFYTCANGQHLQKLVNRHQSPFRVFFGLSGWQQGQLDAEVNQGIWLPSHACSLLLQKAIELSDGGKEPIELWNESLLQFENRFFHDVLGIDPIPTDPSCN